MLMKTLGAPGRQEGKRLPLLVSKAPRRCSLTPLQRARAFPVSPSPFEGVSRHLLQAGWEHALWRDDGQPG